MSDTDVAVENLFGTNCRNCAAWTDFGGIVGQCGNEYSVYFRSPTRHDFRCPSHPLVSRMLKNTVVGRRHE